MPLTPKGYCDLYYFEFIYFIADEEAEMPLTPKGYCDAPLGGS